MQLTAIGTVWKCEVVPNDDERPYTVQLVEYLPGRTLNDSAMGQAISLTLDAKEPLDEGIPYRVTARVVYIIPTQEGDDISVYGILLEAKQIE